MARFDHQGCALHYQITGQGAPLLLLHGLGSSGLDWEYQVPVLAERYKVITLDLRGHGQSAKPRGPYSIPGFAADVRALLAHLSCGPVHLVGLSMGGMIGLQLAVDDASLLRSLCVVNSGPQVRIRSPRDGWQWFKRWSLMRLVSMATIGRGLGRNLFPREDQAELRAKVAQRWAANDKRAYLASFDAIVGWSVQERLGAIDCPTLVISADHDYTPVAVKEHYVTLIPGARLAVIADSRHATPLDQPERFNQTLLRFIAATDNTPKDR